MKVIDTSKMQWEEFKKYSPKITREANRFCAKFPDDMTAEALVSECIEGARKLWIVLGDDDEFQMFFTTRFGAIPATGKELITASTLAGSGYKEAFGEMNRVLEDYAASTSADIMQIEGRDGHWPMLKKFGFKRHAVVYRKEIIRDE